MYIAIDGIFLNFWEFALITRTELYNSAKIPHNSFHT